MVGELAESLETAVIRRHAIKITHFLIDGESNNDLIVMRRSLARFSSNLPQATHTMVSESSILECVTCVYI